MVKVTEEDYFLVGKLQYLFDLKNKNADDKAVELIAAHREAATLKERERCAGVAEDQYISTPDDDHQLGLADAAISIATAIRNIKEG